MHNEQLAVVDDHDQVLKYLPRGEIHACGLLHRAVHILVFNQLGQLFLQKRSMQKDSNPGLWDSSAAGHVDAGEDYDSCAPRELSEELGVAAQLQSLFKLAPTPELGIEFIQVYKCEHNGPFVLASEEIDEGAWFTTDEIVNRVTSNDPRLTFIFKIIWQKYQYSIAKQPD
jgi:isopentenyldiphosphate isomerase